MRRNTQQREAIRSTLARADRPMAPAEIHRAASDRVPGLGIATVYRNLRSLADEGFLHEVELPGGGPIRYEVAGKGHHHHFHCRRCDRVFEVDDCPGDLTTLAPPGFRPESHEIILYGLCARCAEPGAAAAR